jgi:hypothetical protein
LLTPQAGDAPSQSPAANVTSAATYFVFITIP